MLISINRSFPIEAPHEAPWRTPEGYVRTNPAEWSQDVDFMAYGGARLAPLPPPIDPSTERLVWDGEGWVVAPYTPPPPPVPAQVTNAQARAALMRAGLFVEVDAAIKAVGGEALQFWEYANDVTRNGPLVNQMAASLGLAAEQLDNLFRAAAEIEA